jgi:hypothetical protein
VEYLIGLEEKKMKTKFPYGKIDYAHYLERYLEREDAFCTLPTKEEIWDLARKSIVKEALVLAPLPQDAPVQVGDTLILRVESALPKFNKPQVKVTVGRGFYDPTLEQALVGLTQGQSCQVEIKGTCVKAEIRSASRKIVPEPTDEMVQAMEVKRFDQTPVTTVADYVDFIQEQKNREVLSTIHYYVMEMLLQDYSVTEIEPSDLARLAKLEGDAFAALFQEEKGVDVYALTPEEAQEHFGCESFDAFLGMREEWYRIKVQQCLVLLNVLGLPDEGETDPLDHYEVLSELTDRMYEQIKKMLMDRSK